jgi:hypothetical protein
MNDNLDSLEWYLKSAETGIEKTLRRYRTNNCLNAVVMGYNGQGADASLIKNVQEWRQAYVAGFSQYDVKKQAASWQWDSQLKQLIEYYQVAKEEFIFLRENLTHRSKNGSRENRPELYKFLELMDTAART